MKNILLSVCLLSLIVVSCSQKKDFITLPSGLKYMLVEDKKAPKGKEGEYLVANVRYTTDKDSLLFSTIDKKKDGIDIPLGKPQFAGDVMEGFMLLGKGDSAVFLMPVDSVFKNRERPKFFKAGGSIKIYIRCLNVISKEEFDQKQKDDAAKQISTDDAIIQKYMTDQKISATKTTSGLYYVIEKKGNGAMPKVGETVTVNYSGQTLDGQVFDSNTDPLFKHVEPFEFKLGQQRVIPGWDEGVALLNVGSKATFLIPSGLGYGTHGAGAKIPANAVLCFHIELLSVKPTTTIQPQMQHK